MRNLAFLLVLAACKKDEPADATQTPGGDLELTYPEAGAWMGVGDDEARGTAHNVESVTVSGTEAEQRGPQFQAPISLRRGINLIEAEATDLRGDTLFARHGVIAGTFASPNGDIADALMLRANQGALDAAGELAAGYLDPDTLNASLTAINPVYSDTYIWDTVTVNADIESVSFGTPDIRITPSSGTLTLTATLPDLEVWALAYADAFGYDFDSELSLSASEAVVTGELQIDAENGELVVELKDASVELKDFAYTVDLLPDWVTEYVLVDTIKSTIEEKVQEQIETMVPPLLEEALGGLDPSFEMELLGTTVALSFSFASVDVDSDGLAISLDTDVEVPESGDVTYEGYLTADDGVPDVDTTADIAAAISDDFLNRVLFEAWAGGVLNLQLSTDDGSLEPAMLTMLKAEEGTISVSANLPPVAVERDGDLFAQVGELMITIDTPGGELGEHIELAVAADVPLEVVVQDGELVLDIGDPALTFEVRESDWGASNETVTRLLEEMLPLDTLLLLLGDFSFPLPSLYGLQIDTGTAGRDDDGVHTDMQVWLR
jgi:hypothetical protein